MKISKERVINLHFDLYVSISEAVLGVSKEIGTVNGKVRIKLGSRYTIRKNFKGSEAKV